MRILIATDAWQPQINGVVRAFEALTDACAPLGANLKFLTPEGFSTVPLPGYREIRLALPGFGQIAGRIEAASPDAIHIATEGPIGFLVRRYCLARGRPFTTSFHTRYPDYVSARVPVPKAWTWALLRRFHNAGRAVMTATRTMESELAERGFLRIQHWPLGVDTEGFRPRPGADLGFPRPVFLTVARLAVEKNMEAFLALDLPGSKVVVGDGPARADLQRRFPDAHFLGVQQGETLARSFAAADVFVFPSRTDTFGLVLLEALASGLPVAAFPVPGPADVLGDAPVGVLDHDLRRAALAALKIPREACRAFAQRYTWRESARAFLDNIVRASECCSDAATSNVPRSNVAA